MDSSPPKFAAENNQPEHEEGEALLETLVAASGLPKDAVVGELNKILHDTGYQSDRELTLEELRVAMLSYLESLNESLSADENLTAESAESVVEEKQFTQPTPIGIKPLKNSGKNVTRH
ncbi:MAG: hypothetical protein AB7P04_01775 [Bacteriovoracia bacterium]